MRRGILAAMILVARTGCGFSRLVDKPDVVNSALGKAAGSTHAKNGYASSTPAVAGRKIFLRTESRLYCIPAEDRKE